MGRLPCNHYLFHYPSRRVIADFHVMAGSSGVCFCLGIRANGLGWTWPVLFCPAGTRHPKMFPEALFPALCCPECRRYPKMFPEALFPAKYAPNNFIISGIFRYKRNLVPVINFIQITWKAENNQEFSRQWSGYLLAESPQIIPQ